MLKIMIGILIFVNANAFTTDQKQRIRTVYNIAKTIKFDNGFSFENTVSAIYIRESSAGAVIVGDKYHDKFYYKHYDTTIYIDKNKCFKSNNKLWYMYKGKYKKRIYIKKGVLKPIYQSSLGGFQIKMSTARLVIRKFKLKQYYYLLTNDVALVNRLMLDIRFGVNIATRYLWMGYTEAKKRNMWNPYFKCISRYNGGWFNTTYYKKVMVDMKKLKVLVKHNFK